MPTPDSEESVYLVYLSPALLSLPSMFDLLKLAGAFRGLFGKRVEENQVIKAMQTLGWMVVWPTKVNEDSDFGPTLAFDAKKDKVTVRVPWRDVFCIAGLSEESAERVMGFIPPLA